MHELSFFSEFEELTGRACVLFIILTYDLSGYSHFFHPLIVLLYKKTVGLDANVRFHLLLSESGNVRNKIILCTF